MGKHASGAASPNPAPEPTAQGCPGAGKPWGTGTFGGKPICPVCHLTHRAMGIPSVRRAGNGWSGRVPGHQHPQAPPTPKRLTWEQHEYQEVGRAGGVILFSISWRIIQSDPDWSMASRLPGYDARDRRWKDSSKDKLKALAEKLPEAWLQKVGQS